MKSYTKDALEKIKKFGVDVKIQENVVLYDIQKLYKAHYNDDLSDAYIHTAIVFISWMLRQYLEQVCGYNVKLPGVNYKVKVMITDKLYMEYVIGHVTFWYKVKEGDLDYSKSVLGLKGDVLRDVFNQILAFTHDFDKNNYDLFSVLYYLPYL